MQAFSSEQSIKIETKARKWGGEGGRKNLALPFLRLLLLSAARETFYGVLENDAFLLLSRKLEKKKGHSNILICGTT